MNKINFLLMALVIAGQLWAQVPHKLNYQSVIRNTDNSLVKNTKVGIQVSILQGSVNGQAVYREIHTPVTNAQGLCSFEIGTGSKSWFKPGFEYIDWGNGPMFLKTEVDLAGGTSYTITEISQIVSVPYALHAQTTEGLTKPITESDPVFESSLAGTITSSDLSMWNNKQEKLIAGKGIIIRNNEIFLNPAIADFDTLDGIAKYYPNDENIGTDPNVILQTNFENPVWTSDWNAGSSHTLVTSNESENFVPFDGKALQVTIPEGEHTGISITYRFKQKTGSEPEEIYFRYYLRIGNGWSPSFSGKFPGIAGTYNTGGWGGRPSDGYNGWSARGLYEKTINGKTPVGNYVYHAGMQGQWGTYFIWNTENRGYLEKNRWYCIEMYVKLNTPGMNDGILRGWVDGEPAYEKTNLLYRKTSDLKIETIWLDVYHGGTDVAPRDQVLFIDNIVVAKKYIGPVN